MLLKVTDLFLDYEFYSILFLGDVPFLGDIPFFGDIGDFLLLLEGDAASFFFFYDIFLILMILSLILGDIAD